MCTFILPHSIHCVLKTPFQILKKARAILEWIDPILQNDPNRQVTIFSKGKDPNRQLTIHSKGNDPNRRQIAVYSKGIDQNLQKEVQIFSKGIDLNLQKDPVYFKEVDPNLLI